MKSSALESDSVRCFETYSSKKISQLKRLLTIFVDLKVPSLFFSGEQFFKKMLTIVSSPKTLAIMANTNTGISYAPSPSFALV